MSDSKIASRYALSLYIKASETGVLEAVVSDIRSLNEVTSKNREFSRFLNSPLITRETKKATLSKIFASFNQETIHLFSLMADKGRESMIGSMGAEFVRIYNKNNRITVAEISSASELDSDSLNKAEQFVKASTGANTVEISTKVDPSLIGGMTIMFEGKIYDSSIATQIKKMKSELNIA